MADPRIEIREAFQKEQSAFPPPAALRHEVLQTLGEASQRRGNAAAGARPNRQWLAVGAAILLTVAIVAGFMAVRFEHATVVPGRPGPITHVTAPQAIPGTDYGPPPAGVPLL